MARLLPRKRRWRVLLAALALLAVAWFAVPQLLVPTIRAKLQAMVASQLRAEVSIDSLRYAPPYGLRARGVRLSADDPKHGRVELLKVGVLDLKLAKLPIGDGPLVIENITVRDPEVHVVFAGGDVVGRRDAGAGGRDAAGLPPGTKVSDMFVLNHFGLSGGRVVVEDRDDPASAPVVWQALDVDVQTAPRSKSAYDFSLATDPEGPADLRAEGAFDLDALWLELKSLRLTIRAGGPEDDVSAMPANVQAFLRSHDVRGRVTLDGAGRLPLRDPAAGHFAGALELNGGSAAVPERDARIDHLAARLTFAKPPPPPGAPAGSSEPTTLTLERLSCESGPARLSASSGPIVLDAVKQAWSARDFVSELAFAPAEPAATARTAQMQSRTAPAMGSATSPGSAPDPRPTLFGPLAPAGRATLRLSGGGRLGAALDAGGVDINALAIDARVESLVVQSSRMGGPLRDVRAKLRKEAGTRVVQLGEGACMFDNDAIVVSGARVTLPDDLRALADGTRVEEVSGSIDFRPPYTVYPGGFGRTVARLAPAGMFEVGGGSWYGFARYDVDPAADSPRAGQSRRKADYFFSVSTDRARFDLLDGRVAVTETRGDATVSPLSVAIDNIEGRVYGGTLTGAFHVTPGKPRGFHGDVSLADLQLKQVADAFELPPHHRERLSGNGYLSVAFAGNFPVKGSDDWLDSLRADGQFEVFGGQFWTLPILGHVAERVRLSDRVVVGEAAGQFGVYDRKIDLRHAAVQSPALGLIGSGTILFDRAIDLKVIAAPLGDWRERLKRGRIPILSDVAAEVFGTIQQVLNAATSTLLYEFRVSGDLKEPKVEAVPAPALTEPAALLLGQMIRDGKERKWAETARKKP